MEKKGSFFLKNIFNPIKYIKLSSICFYPFRYIIFKKRGRVGREVQEAELNFGNELNSSQRQLLIVKTCERPLVDLQQFYYIWKKAETELVINEKSNIKDTKK